MSVRDPKLLVLRRHYDRGLLHQSGELAGVSRSTIATTFHRGRGGGELTACLINMSGTFRIVQAWNDALKLQIGKEVSMIKWWSHKH